jgi:hypothetical protein
MHDDALRAAGGAAVGDTTEQEHAGDGYPGSGSPRFGAAPRWTATRVSMWSNGVLDHGSCTERMFHMRHLTREQMFESMGQAGAAGAHG